MDFKLPRYHVGISEGSGGSIKIAVLQKTYKGWVLSQCKTIFSPSDLVLPKASYVSASFSLRGSLSLTKSFVSSLKKKANMLKTALYDLDHLSAFPRASLAIAHNFGHKTTTNHTPMTLWLTQIHSIERKLLPLTTWKTFPSKITCLTSDLFHLLKSSSLTTLPAYFFIFTGAEETVCLCVHEGALVLSRTLSSFDLDAIKETFHHAQEINPAIPLSEIYVSGLQEDMKEALKQHLSVNIMAHPLHPTLLPQYQEFQEAILAAYHGASNQSISFPYDFLRHKKMRMRWMKKSLKLLGLFTCLQILFIGGISYVKLAYLQHQVKDNYEVVFSQPIHTPNTLQNYHQALDQQETQIPQYYPYLPTILTSNECLNLLSSLTESLTTIHFHSFKYNLEQKPTSAAPQTPYKATVLITGEGSAEDIQTFVAKLSKHPQCQHMNVDNGKESSFSISWTLCEERA